MLSYQSLMPAGAGTPRYEKLELWHGTANWHRGFCHAPPPPQRGTSLRTTFPSPHPLWIPALAGVTQWGRRVDVGGGIAVGVRSRDVSAWIPAFAGMTNRGDLE